MPLSLSIASTNPRRRWSRPFEDGNLGRITSAIASHAWWRGQSYYDSGDWRGTWAMDGGGATMNQTVHTIDLMVSILGVPVEVFAYTACLAHERIEVEDTAVAVVKFDSGALGIIHATTAAYPGLDASLRIFGSKGSAVISDDELIYLHENSGEAPEIAMPDGTDLNQVGHEYRFDRIQAGTRTPRATGRFRPRHHRRQPGPSWHGAGPHRAVCDPRHV